MKSITSNNRVDDISVVKHWLTTELCASRGRNYQGILGSSDHFRGVTKMVALAQTVSKSP